MIFFLVDIRSHVSGFKSCLYLDMFSFVFWWLAENAVTMIMRTFIDVHLAVQEHIGLINDNIFLQNFI